MKRLLLFFVFAAPLMFLAASGCSQSGSDVNPKVQFKDTPPIKPVEPGGPPVKKGAPTKGPGTNSA